MVVTGSKFSEYCWHLECICFVDSFLYNYSDWKTGNGLNDTQWVHLFGGLESGSSKSQTSNPLLMPLVLCCRCDFFKQVNRVLFTLYILSSVPCCAPVLGEGWYRNQISKYDIALTQLSSNCCPPSILDCTSHHLESASSLSPTSPSICKCSQGLFLSYLA